MKFLLLLIAFSYSLGVAAQSLCLKPAFSHKITSQALGEEREYWVGLPYLYDSSNADGYRVIYVLDAEWRFELIRQIVYDLGANKLIQPSIVVGIPHIDWKKKRGVDLTFSQSRTEYDGDSVDSTYYNATNSGGAQHFRTYLLDELIPAINAQYNSNGHETFIGHSFGGYFGAYLLGGVHPFDVFHLYDPSIWYSNGEAIDHLMLSSPAPDVTVHVTYQPIPSFHKEKIEAFIAALRNYPNVTLSTQFYPDATHNALFLDSFYKGILNTQQ